ncbi:hypothetical protein BurJ1DRAFT_3068 [Burkholderiales bacterium JOSHI_001]|nr:hypothetical protein BurJ1DRAFT_3068 [Burkholderiales bacterium JOSHI_001]
MPAMSLLPTLPRLLPLTVLALAPLAAQAHDYPTADRVVFVQACMRDHPGPHYEMLNKCACALDKLAEQFSYEQFVDMNTVSNATTIGGERGSYIRDTESLQLMIRNYRKAQAAAKSGCFINLDAK